MKRGKVRNAGRLAVLVFGAAIIALVSVQYARIVGQNVERQRSLVKAQDDITKLRRKKAADEAAIRRLRDPAGAVPEIHERLKLTKPNETIIYVKRSPAPSR